ncbi:hypothetical protein HNR34_002197 [Geobacillus subterraneus]
MLYEIALLTLLIAIIWGGAHIALNAENRSSNKQRK